MRALTLALTLALSMPAGADSLRILSTADDIRGLEAVGRVDYDLGRTSGYCTGTLVSPTLVLTAAHCLFQEDGTAVPTDAIRFRAGLRNGHSDGERLVRRMVIHPHYRSTATPTHESVSTDLALLELDRGLERPDIRPFPASGRLEPGDSVQVVSYARGRSDAPAHQADCSVMQRSPRILILDCEATFGASGAPVFVQTDDGLRIVSVISAGGTLGDERATYAVTVEDGLADLMNAMATLPRMPSDRKFIRPGDRSGAGGSIRFIRPEG